MYLGVEVFIVVIDGRRVEFLFLRLNDVEIFLVIVDKNRSNRV